MAPPSSFQHIKHKINMNFITATRQLIYGALGLILLSVTLGTQAAVWDADSLYNQSHSSTHLRLSVNNAEVAQIPTSWIRVLVETRNRIQAEAGTYSKLLIIDDPVVNAYASSSGQNTIWVTIKMLEMLDGDTGAIAALMGHETAHLTRNHYLKTIARTTIFQLLGNLAAQALEAKLQARGVFAGLGTDLADNATQLVKAKFSRDQEREADDYGTRWMLKLGYDPNGALRLHQHLLNRRGTTPDSYFDSHPPSTERMQSIQTLIAQYSQPRETRVAQSPTPTRPSNSIQSPAIQTGMSPSPALSKGEVGVVLTLKPRYGYVIFSGTTQQALPVGTRLKVIGGDGAGYFLKVARAIDGYYSGTVEGDVDRLSIGDKIEVN